MSTGGDETSPSQIQRVLDLSVYAPLGFMLNREAAVADMAKKGRDQVAFARSLGRAALKGLAKGAAAKSTMPTRSTSQRPATAPSRRKSVTTAGATAVPGYGEMTAREVISLLATCTDAQRRWIHDQEQRGKQRVTVLRAIEAQADSS